MHQPHHIRSISRGRRPLQAPIEGGADRETLLIEILLGGLDLRANATMVGSPMLTYLTDLLVMRAREELEKVAHAPTTLGEREREGAA